MFINGISKGMNNVSSNNLGFNGNLIVNGTDFNTGKPRRLTIDAATAIVGFAHSISHPYKPVTIWADNLDNSHVCVNCRHGVTLEQVKSAYHRAKTTDLNIEI